jgi:hypothetical protein
MEKWTTLEFITWMHHARLCWISSVDPSFPSFISAMNLLTANSVFEAFDERRLTNVIPPPQSVKCNPYGNEQAKFWKVQVAANFERTSRYSHDIWGKTRLRFKGVHLLEVLQSTTVGFQLFVVAAGSYEMRTNVRVVSSGKGSDIRSGETVGRW